MLLVLFQSSAVTQTAPWDRDANLPPLVKKNVCAQKKVAVPRGMGLSAVRMATFMIVTVSYIAQPVFLAK